MVPDVALKDVGATVARDMAITTLEESAQVPLVIFHLKILFPGARPVTVEPAFAGLVIEPLPLTNVQTPEYGEGELPARVAEVVVHND
jgi:hypothetical protein